MGVRGLWKKVLNDYQRRRWNFEINIDPRESVLLVDAMGFIFHLFDNQLPTLYADYSIKGQFGGCYVEIEDLFSCEIQRLTETVGFHQLIFYFDGPDSYYKGDTTAKRREQVLEVWENMYYCSLDGVNANNDLSFPLPPLCGDALMYILHELKIPFILSKFESDQDMAKACSEWNDSNHDGKQYYCYAADR